MAVQIQNPNLDIDMLRPQESVAGYAVCPGIYDQNGAQALGYGGAVNFTVHSNGADAVELLLFHRSENDPYAVIPFPKNYRIGDVWSMVVAASQVLREGTLSGRQVI